MGFHYAHLCTNYYPYSYKDVHNKNPYKNNISSHSYRDMNVKNPYKNNMDSHSYKDVHDEKLIQELNR